MEFRILGPLEVLADGQALPLGGVRSRALLALLLLHRNEVVSVDRIVDGVWGESPPATAAKSVQVYISRLRKLLASAGWPHSRLVTRPPGYRLEVAPEELDLARFEEHVERARAAGGRGEDAVAASELRTALALWRGAPLADLAFEPFAQTAAMRLEELRLDALEARVEADLDIGRASELVGELSVLVREQPFRERLRASLMLALYRSGRQADALDAYREARRVLVDELGIDPGPRLSELEVAILRHDPALDVHGATRSRSPRARDVKSESERPSAAIPIAPPEEGAPEARLSSDPIHVDDGERVPVERGTDAVDPAGRRATFDSTLSAARRAQEAGANAEARACYRRALELWQPEYGLIERAGLLLSFGRLLMRVTHEEEAYPLLREAAADFERLGDGTAATAAEAAAAEARFNLGETAEAVADARALAARVGPGSRPEIRTLVLLSLARLLSLRGEVAEALDAATEGLALIGGAPSRPQTIARARLLNVVGGAMWLEGDEAAGAREMLESARLAAAVGDDVGVVRAYTNLAISAIWYGSGPLERAAAWADAGLEVASAHALLPARAWLLTVRATIQLLAGQGDAPALLGEADLALAGAGPVPHVRVALQGARAECRLADGDLDAAARGFAAVVEDADRLGHPGSWCLVRDGLARACLAQGDATGATEALAPAIAAIRAQPTFITSFPWLVGSAVEARLMLNDVKEATELARWVEQDASCAFGRFVGALVDRRAPALERARRVEAAAGELESTGRHSPAARLRLVGAQQLAREGEHEAAANLADGALRRFRALGRPQWSQMAERLLRPVNRSEGIL